jgi:hypothetical protein
MKRVLNFTSGSAVVLVLLTALGMQFLGEVSDRAPCGSGQETLPNMA